MCRQLRKNFFKLPIKAADLSTLFSSQNNFSVLLLKYKDFTVRHHKPSAFILHIKAVLLRLKQMIVRDCKRFCQSLFAHRFLQKIDVVYIIHILIIRIIAGHEDNLRVRYKAENLLRQRNAAAGA